MQNKRKQQRLAAMSETLEHGDTDLYLCEPLEHQVIGYTLAERRSLAAALSQFPLKGAEGLIKDGDPAQLTIRRVARRHAFVMGFCQHV